MRSGLAELTRRTTGLRTQLAIGLNLITLIGFGLAFIDCVASLAQRI